jgi:hypothetical protein
MKFGLGPRGCGSDLFFVPEISGTGSRPVGPDIPRLGSGLRKRVDVETGLDRLPHQ